MERSNDRKLNQLRSITIEPNVNIHAEGSVLVSFGNTKVVCTATIDTNVPRWMRGSDEGWVTAEYGMLPRSTNESCLLYTSPSPRDRQKSRMPSSA